MPYGKIISNIVDIEEDSKIIRYKGIAHELYFKKEYNWIMGEVDLIKTTLKKNERSRIGKFFMRSNYYWSSEFEWHLDGLDEWHFDPLMIGRNDPREVIFNKNRKPKTDYYLSEDRESLHTFAKRVNEAYARKSLYQNRTDHIILPSKEILIKIFAPIDQTIINEYDSIVAGK